MDKPDFEYRMSLSIPASYSMSSGSSYPGGKAQREDNHLPPSSFEVKNEWSKTPTPLICVNGMYDDVKGKGKGKLFPLQTRCGPEGG